MLMKKGAGKKPLIYGLIVAVILIVAGGIIFSGHSPVKNNNTQSGTVFAGSPYFQYAYLISTPDLNAQTKNALAGFKLGTTQNTDGTVTYTLTTTKSGYFNQTYTVKPGEKLYFIERSLGDDDVTNDSDYALGDDTAIIVDANGYII